jgi:iodothyronine deiodinase-like protein
MFGNLSCGQFRSRYPLVENVKHRYRDNAEFLAVYVREAHPTDGWRLASNTHSGIQIAQPRTYEEHVAVARQCYAKLQCSMPLVVDTIKDRVGNTYSGLPARLYVIDRLGKVAYKSGRGPYGFKPGELEQALIMALLDQQIQTSAN